MEGMDGSRFCALVNCIHFCLFGVWNQLFTNDRCLDLIKNRRQSGEGLVCSRADGVQHCVISIKIELGNKCYLCFE